MTIGGFELKDMPSYEDFKTQPTHLYSLKQDLLNSRLQMGQVQMDPNFGAPSNQSSQWQGGSDE